MDRFLRVEQVDVIFMQWWSKLGQSPGTLPLALQETRSEVGARLPADYVPPPQRAAVPGAPLSDKRKDMLALVEMWFPTTLNSPRRPPGQPKDLLELAGWTTVTGAASQKVRTDNAANGTHNPIATSCGDVLATMLRLWKSGFVGAFMIRDMDASSHKPGAKGRGYYVEANGSNTPQPGDILVMRNGIGPGTEGTVGHVDILVAITDDAKGSVWTTADGGGGMLPDQSAAKTDRRVEFGAKNVPILVSVTDGKRKQVDGWIDLDRLPRDP
jgi:hypothetical protein